ncbi:hypothetical protein EPUS_01472 [Endocarpon pusillum Z07020]|uniref:Uncharacterized protein n=1 Tax=Endocarpon pusillum (strain Z07020 / HMAS-L-300199) TaxID=1263415 RepID=U1GUL9_ENDPU|nr:uncharacterized protein EPUS_01472 [Endocarpon pusillum Z07020]ERF76138.1 hypothetical protein EPUS_01472 [Endocarpon pusillum Z07020]
MLPEYKGPAPLHWTILNGEKKTGMSLQTLHPISFDEGIILDQTPWPGIDVPEDCDYSVLLEIMQLLGADMLLNAIKNRLYLPPYIDAGWAKNAADGKKAYKHAPKIETAHKLLCFETMDSLRMARMSRAFESTWAFAAVPTRTSELKRLRIIFPKPFKILSPPSVYMDGMTDISGIPPGLPYWPDSATNEEKGRTEQPLLVNTIDGKAMLISSIQVEGSVEMPAYKAAQKHGLMPQPRHVKTKGVITFHECLTAQP